MTPKSTEEGASDSGLRWWGAWAVISVLVVGGVVLALRLGPRITSVLDALR